MKRCFIVALVVVAVGACKKADKHEDFCTRAAKLKSDEVTAEGIKRCTAGLVLLQKLSPKKHDCMMGCTESGSALRGCLARCSPPARVGKKTARGRYIDCLKGCPGGNMACARACRDKAARGHR